MRRTTVLLITVLAISVIWLQACSDDDHGSMHGNNTMPSPKIVSVYPPDDASGISTAASISIKFDVPMDTTSVMASFHLSGGSNMHAWMDSVGHLGGMGNMGQMNMDHMMDWMNSMQYSGHFNWNGAMDSCEFIPDSPLTPDTDHMLFMHGDVKGHNGMMMDMHHQDCESYMYHFQTGT